MRASRQLWIDDRQAFEQGDVAEPLVGADEEVNGGWLLKLDGNAELKRIERANLSAKAVLRDEIPGAYRYRFPRGNASRGRRCQKSSGPSEAFSSFFFDNDASHRILDFRGSGTNLFNRWHVLPLDLSSARLDGLLVNQIVQSRHPAVGPPGMVVFSKASYGLFQQGFLGWKRPALNLLADEFSQFIGQRQFHETSL
jgi:hypothetical protein